MGLNEVLLTGDIKLINAELSKPPGEHNFDIVTTFISLDENKHVVLLDTINNSPACEYLYSITDKLNVIDLYPDGKYRQLSPDSVLSAKFERMIKTSNISWINTLSRVFLPCIAQGSHSNPVTLRHAFRNCDMMYMDNIRPLTEECFDVCVDYRYNFNWSDGYLGYLVRMRNYALIEKLLQWNNKGYTTRWYDTDDETAKEIMTKYK